MQAWKMPKAVSVPSRTVLEGKSIGRLGPDTPRDIDNVWQLELRRRKLQSPPGTGFVCTFTPSLLQTPRYASRMGLIRLKGATLQSPKCPFVVRFVQVHLPWPCDMQCSR